MLPCELVLAAQEGVVGVLTASTTDVLSHVAIRARSQQVLLATCFDSAELSELKGKHGEQVSLAVSPNGAVTTTAAFAQVCPPHLPSRFTPALNPIESLQKYCLLNE